MSVSSNVCSHFYTLITNANHIGVARIVPGGCTFLPKKVDDLFLVITLDDHLNIPPNLSHPAKNVLKFLLKTGWGCTLCPGGALTHFSCKLGLKKIFFHRPGGEGAPTAPPGYTYG